MYLSICAGLAALQVPRAYHHVQALEHGIRQGLLLVSLSVVGIVIRHNRLSFRRVVIAWSKHTGMILKNNQQILKNV
jgi:hypothetical protein